jgi:hypothetical protein
MAERATGAAPERGLLGSVEPTFEPEVSAYRLVRDDHPVMLGAAPAENVGGGLSVGAGESVAQWAEAGRIELRRGAIEIVDRTSLETAGRC